MMDVQTQLDTVKNELRVHYNNLAVDSSTMAKEGLMLITPLLRNMQRLTDMVEQLAREQEDIRVAVREGIRNV